MNVKQPLSCCWMVLFTSADKHYIWVFLLFWCYLVYSMLFWCYLVYSMLFWCYLVYSMLFWCYLVYSMSFWCYLVYSMLFWCYLVYSILFLRCRVINKVTYYESSNLTNTAIIVVPCITLCGYIKSTHVVNIRKF